MQRQAAFLRGVSPMNCKMPALAEAFRQAGFADVRTLLSSGNVVFSAKGTAASLEKKCEAAIERHLGRSFMTFVRPLAELQALLDADPFARLDVPAGAKKVVTFLQAPPRPAPALPIEQGGARVLALHAREVFSAYVPGPE